nr:DnaJ C-terminal domain-containing protein [Ramlibacter aurantiacus]
MEDPAPAERVLDQAIELSLEEALAGCSRDVQGVVVDDCHACSGSGLQPACACSSCGGSGQLRQSIWFGWVAPTVTCEACDGRGHCQPACDACEGSGRGPARSWRARVRIPAGSRGGDVLQVPVRSRRAGDGKLALRVRIDLAPHPFFTLEADGVVRVEVPVDGFAWTAERWIDVPTPSGLQQMKLRRGHLAYRIKGQGFASEPAGPRADCLVTVVPLFPETLGRDQEASIDALVKSNTGRPGTPAGQRAGAWRRTLDAWSRKRGAADGQTM